MVEDVGLLEVAKELGERLTRIFLKDASGARPAFGDAQAFRDDQFLIVFV